MFPSEDIAEIERRLSNQLNAPAATIDVVLALILVAQRIEEIAGLLERRFTT